jgi:hypothetical protein
MFIDLGVEYRVGEEVAFRNSCQPGMPPFKVQEVDPSLFGTRYKVNYKWWTEGNLMPYAEWKKL